VKKKIGWKKMLRKNSKQRGFEKNPHLTGFFFVLLPGFELVVKKKKRPGKKKCRLWTRKKKLFGGRGPQNIFFAVKNRLPDPPQPGPSAQQRGGFCGNPQNKGGGNNAHQTPPKAGKKKASDRWELFCFSQQGKNLRRGGTKAAFRQTGFFVVTKKNFHVSPPPQKKKKKPGAKAPTQQPFRGGQGGFNQITARQKGGDWAK